MGIDAAHASQATLEIDLAAVARNWNALRERLAEGWPGLLPEPGRVLPFGQVGAPVKGLMYGTRECLLRKAFG